MDAIRLGAVFRAVRIRKRWRQVDVAAAAGVSQATVSRIERGHLRLLSVDAILRVAEALEIRIDWSPRWRGGDLDRMLNAGHAAMHNSVARLFRRLPWLTAPEVTFAIYGERGTIDILAFHPPTGTLAVIELKTELVDVQHLIASVDRYRRLAPRIAKERGWIARSVGCWVVLRDTATNRRRVSAHADVLRVAFPDDGRTMRRWLRAPDGQVAGLSFIGDGPRRSSGSASSSGIRRVRRAA
jgi:transcriptional regulator with XRE-family HTH domain